MRVFFLFLFLLVDISSVHGYSGDGGGRLKVGFYRDSCPKAEAIVRQTVAGYVANDPTVTAPLLRLHFHDCFVDGCEGSVLINSTKTNKAEKDAKPNLTLDGFYVIDDAKKRLERKCPGKVSCADIVAIAARDAVSLATAAVRKGQWAKDDNLYEVETGRRDGSVSSRKQALKNLPSSFDGFAELRKRFYSKGLTLKDLVVLSGGHAIGNSHCFSLARRLRHFSARHNTDPTLDVRYAAHLRKECKPGDNTTQLEMVPESSTSFDNKYYGLVVENKGLFYSDEALLRNSKTRSLVYEYAKSQESFFKDFGPAMVNMGRVGVLTGKEGGIRKRCALFETY